MNKSDLIKYGLLYAAETLLEHSRLNINNNTFNRYRTYFDLIRSSQDLPVSEAKNQHDVDILSHLVTIAHSDSDVQAESANAASATADASSSKYPVIPFNFLGPNSILEHD